MLKHPESEMSGSHEDHPHVKFVEDPKHSDPLAAHDSHKIHISQLGPGELLADLGYLQEGCEYSAEVDLAKTPACLEYSKAFSKGIFQVVESSCSTVRLIAYDSVSSVMTIHLTADVPKKWTRHLVVKSKEDEFTLAFKLVANVLPIGFGTPLLHDGIHVVSHNHSSLEDDQHAEMR